MISPNAIQDAIKTYLTAHPWFTANGVTVPVFSQDEGDLENKIAASLSDLTCGLALLVTVPAGTNREPNSARVSLESTLEIQCIEMPIISRAVGGIGKTAYQAARVICSPNGSANKGLHDWRGTTHCSALSLQGFSAETNERGGLIYSVRFTFNETIT